MTTPWNGRIPLSLRLRFFVKVAGSAVDAAFFLAWRSAAIPSLAPVRSLPGRCRRTWSPLAIRRTSSATGSQPTLGRRNECHKKYLTANLPHRAADEVRICHQRQGRESARPHDPAVDLAPRTRSLNGRLVE